MKQLLNTSKFHSKSILSVTQNDQSLVRIVFYLIFLNFPQSIFLCLIFCTVSQALKKCQISIWFQRYYFIWFFQTYTIYFFFPPILSEITQLQKDLYVLIQITLELDIDYLAYCGFSQLQILFYFIYSDILLFSYLQLLSLLLCTFGSWQYIFKKKLAILYIAFIAQILCFTFLTIRFFTRAFLQAATHFYCSQFYQPQVMCLANIQILAIVYLIILQKRIIYFQLKFIYFIFDVSQHNGYINHNIISRISGFYHIRVNWAQIGAINSTDNYLFLCDSYYFGNASGFCASKFAESKKNMKQQDQEAQKQINNRIRRLRKKMKTEQSQQALDKRCSINIIIRKN